MKIFHTYKLNGYFLELTQKRLFDSWIDMIILHTILILITLLFKPIGFLCMAIVFLSNIATVIDLIKNAVSWVSLLAEFGIKIDLNYAARTLRVALIRNGITFFVIVIIKLIIV